MTDLEIGKIYSGERLPDGSVSIMVTLGEFSEELERIPLNTRQGLNWGSGGEQAADLSLSLLADAFGEGYYADKLARLKYNWEDESYAVTFHQAFKWDVISKLEPLLPWTMTQESILEWVRSERESCEWCGEELKFKIDKNGPVGWLHHDGSHGMRICENEECKHRWTNVDMHCPKCGGFEVTEHMATPLNLPGRRDMPRRVKLR